MKEDQDKQNQEAKIVVEFGLKTDLSLESVFAFKIKANEEVTGRIYPVKDGFGRVILTMNSSLTFEFIETLQKAIDAFRVKLKDYAS